MNFYDYDSEYIYDPGSFNKQFKTSLDDKINKLTQRIDLPQNTAKSFLDETYFSAISTKELCLYRVFGLYKNKNNENENSRIVGSKNNGSFVTTEFAESLIDVKIRLALDPSWLNTHMYEAKIIVPIGTVLHIGKVAPVTTKGGTKLLGGADQILLPKDWSEDWIIGYRRITQKQLKAVPKFDLLDISPYEVKESLYPNACPVCGCINVKKLVDNERIQYVGSKGNKYTALYLCLNEDCKLMW